MDVLTLELVTDEVYDDWFDVDRVRLIVNGIAMRDLAEGVGLGSELVYHRLPYLLATTSSQVRTAGKIRPLPGSRTVKRRCLPTAADNLVAIRCWPKSAQPRTRSPVRTSAGPAIRERCVSWGRTSSTKRLTAPRWDVFERCSPASHPRMPEPVRAHFDEGFCNAARCWLCRRRC